MAIALAAVLVLIVAGSVLFHLVTPWWQTPIASNWAGIDSTVGLTIWVTGIGFIAVILFMAYCVVRYRHKPGSQAHYEPESGKLEWILASVTAVAVCILLGPGLLVWYDYVTVPKDASQVEVFGQQWSWAYRLPGKDGKLGTVDPRFISTENPLGINPDDPDGKDDIVIASGDLHLPVGKPVHILLRASDVIHNFYVPQFRAKMDLVPGLESYFWFTPTKTGTFEVLCAAFCGVGHPQMRGSIVVESESDYQEWLAKQQTFAELSATTKNASLTK